MHWILESDWKKKLFKCSSTLQRSPECFLSIQILRKQHKKDDDGQEFSLVELKRALFKALNNWLSFDSLQEDVHHHQATADVLWDCITKHNSSMKISDSWGSVSSMKDTIFTVVERQNPIFDIKQSFLSFLQSEFHCYSYKSGLRRKRATKQPLSFTLASLTCLIITQPPHQSYLEAPIFLYCHSKNLSFDMLTSSSQLPLLPVTSTISCFLCSGWHRTWQLSAFCPRFLHHWLLSAYRLITL